MGIEREGYMSTISKEHSDRLYWLGRYTERVFTTLLTLQKLYDNMLDQQRGYTEYLGYFGLPDSYGSSKAFIRSFLYEESNPNSVAYSLERAYDNGIVLREEISTESLSFLQLAKDTLKKSEATANPRLSLLPLKDQLYAFWGCLSDSIFDDEKRNIIYCGRSVERLDLYIRTDYPYKEVKKEFERLCKRLINMPEHTPYCSNIGMLEKLGHIIGTAELYVAERRSALDVLSCLFETSEVRV